jgi:hypothetical protein
MDKVQHEWYGREYQDYYKSDMRFIPSEPYPGSYEMEVEILEENFDDYFKKYPLIYRMVPNLQAPKEEIAYRIAKINEERAHKLLFKLLEQNIRRWWD